MSVGEPRAEGDQPTPRVNGTLRYAVLSADHRAHADLAALLASQDLATLVNDQSGMVDDIADHIGRTADRTQAAQREVVRAERHQRSARSRQCLILVIAACALAVLLLVILS